MAHPVRLARGNVCMPQLMVHRNIDVAMRYHEFVILEGFPSPGRPQPAGAGGGYLLDCARQPIGFHLRADLRHVVPEHDDIVLFAVHIPHMVAQ